MFTCVVLQGFTRFFKRFDNTIIIITQLSLSVIIYNTEQNINKIN